MSPKELLGVVNSCGFGRLSTLYGRQKRAKYISKIASSVSALPEEPFRYIVSIDIGTKNLAWVSYDTSSEIIIRWRLVNLESSSSDLPTLASSVRNTFNDMTSELVLSDTMFVIEKQPPSGLTTVAALFHVLAQLSDELNPDVVCSYKIQHGMDESVVGYRARKKAAVEMVTAWLSEQSSSSMPKMLFHRFEDVVQFLRTKKKDDMADCLLQLFAYVEFLNRRYQTAEYLINKLLQ